MTKIKVKKIKLGIVGGGSGSWIGHVHRIAARFDDQYEIVSGVFSRNTKNSSKFGQSLVLIKYASSLTRKKLLLKAEQLFKVLF